MSLNQEDKDKIDAMGYESMLQLWRNHSGPHHLFQGETGEYFSKVMAEKRSLIGSDEHVAASKRIGWSG